MCGGVSSCCDQVYEGDPGAEGGCWIQSQFKGAELEKLWVFDGLDRKGNVRGWIEEMGESKKEAK